MIRAVLSDWGHTLFDTAGSVDFIERWSGNASGSASGNAVPRQQIVQLYAAAFARSRTPEELAKGRDKSAVVHRQCWLDLYADLDAAVPGVAPALYDFETSPAGWAPFIDTPAFVQALADKAIPLVVVSDVAFDIRAICDHHGIAHLVHSFILSSEHGTVKAEGRLYRIALDAVGVEPHEALMIGDNPSNDGHAVFEGITTLLLPLPAPGQPRGLAAALALLA